MDDVAEIINEVGGAEVLPRWRSLHDDDVIEKSPGDLVTIADRECERILGPRLQAVRDIPVVGEEAAAGDPNLLHLVSSAPAVWLVDPVDGTSNFVAGDPGFGVMVTLIEGGLPSAAWIWLPVTDEMIMAQRGQGLFRNGEPVAGPDRKAKPTGIIKRKYMDEPARTRLADFPPSTGTPVKAMGSAAVEYTALIDGTIDFLMYWRTLPWDHAPGALIAQEAGLRVARVDGSDYRPGDGRVGLLAATPELWPLVAQEINAAM